MYNLKNFVFKPYIYDKPELYNKSNNLSIYNVNGELVLSQEIGNGTHTLHIKTPGFYYLIINDTETAPLIIK